MSDEQLRALLAEYDYPLVRFDRDGVQVCINGTWAYEKTLAAALEAAREKYRKARR